MEPTVMVWKQPVEKSLAPLALPLAAASLDEASRRLPAGAYTTFRTFQRRRVLRLSEHFSRLEETSRLAGRPVRIDRESARAVLRQAIAALAADEVRARISLDLTQEVGALYVMVEALHVPPAEAYQNGVQVVTYRMRRSNPKAKLTSFIEIAESVRKQLPPGINEAVMISEEGIALEGLSSNFFAVTGGEIWTAEQGVLSGITRSMVLDAARSLNIPLRLEGIPAERLSSIDEAFITSASRAVLPVTDIDGQPVGSGRPGPLTMRLAQRYQETIEQSLEDL